MEGKTTVTAHKFAYKLRGKGFYKRSERGSYSLHSKPVTKKEITAPIHKATLFDEPFSEPPHRGSFMDGGEWVSVMVETEFKWSSI